MNSDLVTENSGHDELSHCRERIKELSSRLVATERERDTVLRANIDFASRCAALAARARELGEAVCLLNSMVRSGESHSPVSRALVEQVLRPSPPGRSAGEEGTRRDE
jgi:hypothetical protein